MVLQPQISLLSGIRKKSIGVRIKEGLNTILGDVVEIHIARVATAGATLK